MPELYGMPERYSRISPRDPAASKATIDWPARFRAAADAAERQEWDEFAYMLRGMADEMAKWMDPEEIEAIGRAMLGEDA